MGLEPSGRPLQASSRFDVGSVTKTFVAALVLALVDDGELGLDDDARAYLSTRFEPIGSTTVRSLLNHTSGFPDFFEDAAFAVRWQESPARTWDPDELIEVALALPRHEPGIFSYANSNYVLIGLLIESLTGRSVGELLRRRIFDLLGLPATCFPQRQLPRAARAGSSRRPTTSHASSRPCSPARLLANPRWRNAHDRSIRLAGVAGTRATWAALCSHGRQCL